MEGLGRGLDVPEDFTWLDGERLIRFGEGALDDAPRLLEERGFSDYALLTTDRALAKAPKAAEAADTVLRVPSGRVPQAAAAVRTGVGQRPIVALGGGRVIDSAKAIAGADGLACAAVPTTLSGAEMTGFHRLPADARGGRLVRPWLVVAAPALMASQPMPALAASAMNALAHAVESLYTSLANPVSGMAATRAIALVGEALGRERPARTELALGALLAGYAVGGTGYAVHHVVSQTLVAVTGAPHAETNAVMLPHCVELMTARAPRAVASVATALGGGPDDASDLIAGLSAKAGVTRLAELGVEGTALAEVARQAATRPELQNALDPPDEKQLGELLKRAH